MARLSEPRLLRTIARERLMRQPEPSPEDFEEDRLLQEAGYTVIRTRSVRIVIDLRAGLTNEKP